MSRTHFNDRFGSDWANTGPLILASLLVGIGLSEPPGGPVPKYEVRKARIGRCWGGSVPFSWPGDRSTWLTLSYWVKIGFLIEVTFP